MAAMDVIAAQRGVMFVPVVQHQANCALTHLTGKLARRLTRRRPFLSGILPGRVDHDPCAHGRMPMDMMRHGWLTSLFQAKQQWSTISS